MPDWVGHMFYHSEKPWHGYGVPLPQPATMEEALKHGDLDWEVRLVPIFTLSSPEAEQLENLYTSIEDDPWESYMIGKGLVFRSRRYKAHLWSSYRRDSGTPQIHFVYEGPRERSPRSIVFTEATGKRAAVRWDKGMNRQSSPVLGIVSERYQPLQNRQALEIFDSLVGNHKEGRVYHTGGYLGNGEVIWVLAETPTGFRVGPDDEVLPFLLFTNSHDGSRAVYLKATTVRVVCWNMLPAALSEKTQLFVRRLHLAGNYQSMAAEFRKLLEAEAERLKTLFQALAKKEVKKREFEEFAEWLFPTEVTAQDEKQREKEEKRRATNLEIHKLLLALFDGARREELSSVSKYNCQNPEKLPDAAIRSGTAWAAVNAVTYFVDHLRAGDPKARFGSIHFGSGAKIKQKALRYFLNVLN